MNRKEVMALITEHFKRTAEIEVEIVQLRPTPAGGWTVLLNYGGVRWEQQIHPDGRLGTLVVREPIPTARRGSSS